MIGASAVGVVKANDMMARQQVCLLMQHCFFKKKDVYEPVMVTLSIQRNIPGHSEKEDSASDERVEFKVPLITLIPINSLTIEDAKINFNIDVLTCSDTKEESQDDIFDRVATQKKYYNLEGRIQYATEGEKKQHQAMSINFTTGKLPLPIGVSTLIQAYSHAIQPAK